MVEETNQRGRSGRTMGPNDRLLSLWKKTQGQPCNSFNRRLFASCPSHWHQPFTRHSHPTPLVLSSLKAIPLHRPQERGTLLPLGPIGNSIICSLSLVPHPQIQLFPWVQIAIKVRCHSCCFFPSFKLLSKQGLMSMP